MVDRWRGGLSYWLLSLCPGDASEETANSVFLSVLAPRITAKDRWGTRVSAAHSTDSPTRPPLTTLHLSTCPSPLVPILPSPSHSPPTFTHRLTTLLSPSLALVPLHSHHPHTHCLYSSLFVSHCLHSLIHSPPHSALPSLVSLTSHLLTHPRSITAANNVKELRPHSATHTHLHSDTRIY